MQPSERCHKSPEKTSLLVPILLRNMSAKSITSAAANSYVDLTPSESLRFVLTASGQSRTTLKLTNISDQKVAFKVGDELHVNLICVCKLIWLMGALYLLTENANLTMSGR